MDNDLLERYIRALTEGDIPSISKYSELLLSDIEPTELLNRIERFYLLNLVNLTDEELSCEIERILIHNNVCTIMNSYSLFREGTRFYRVRKLESCEVPNKKLSKLSDFWNPPIDYVSEYGRLNKPHESVLYTAFSLRTALQETHISINDPFAIFVYETKKDVKVSWIGSSTNYKHHHITNPKAMYVHEIIKNFLIKEFTREVPQGHEYFYRITEHIAKEYFVAPEGVGWRYPSVKDKHADNICFASNGLNESLGLVGAIVGVLSEIGVFDFEHIFLGSDAGTAISYSGEEGLALFNKLFPEFKYA